MIVARTLSNQGQGHGTTLKQNVSILLRLIDSVQCRRGYYFGAWVLYFSFGTFYLRHKHKLLILSGLSDFMACSERFNIFSEGSLSQLWNTVGR